MSAWVKCGRFLDRVAIASQTTPPTRDVAPTAARTVASQDADQGLFDAAETDGEIRSMPLR